jgi:hypothetical protein
LSTRKIFDCPFLIMIDYAKSYLNTSQDLQIENSDFTYSITFAQQARHSPREKSVQTYQQAEFLLSRSQTRQVPRDPLRCWIAGDVYDSLGLHFDEGFEDWAFAACARGVDDDCFGADALGVEFG